MKISDWHQTARPREKLLAQGPQALSDAELVAICLRTGVPGQSALDIADALLREFGGLRRLAAATEQELTRTPGLGPAKAAQIRALAEIARRYAAQSLQRGEALESPRAAEDYLRAQLAPHEHEVFACLYLDNRHRVLAFEELFRGTIDSTSVYPREVVKSALRHNAAALLLAHNHPSGATEPSQADIAITRRLSDALALVDIRVLDHLVIGDGRCASLAERGLLQ